MVVSPACHYDFNLSTMNNQRKLFGLPRIFWVVNSLELFERWAYYGIFNLLALYLTNSPDTGALGFSQVEKGLIMGIVNAILYFLPVITGAIADRFGYKRVLIVAFLILTSGYYLLGQVRTFPLVFITFFYVAIGAALFKPVISATIAKVTNDKNVSIGFGIFYMIVNIGAMIGPVIGSELREHNWHYVFIMSSSVILINILILFLFFKDPDEHPSDTSLGVAIRKVFTNIYEALKDFRFLLFLLIISGAWAVYWQLFYSLPVYIDQWVDTTILYRAIAKLSPALAAAIGTADGTVLAEKIITTDAFYIVLFQVLISSFVSRFKALGTMVTGIMINVIGISLAFLTRNGLFLVIALLIFGIGEMSFSPKILEYIARIAPREKAALYMGSQFIPIALGNFICGILSGKAYEVLSDKYTLLAHELSTRGLPSPTVAADVSAHEYMRQAGEILQMSPEAVNNFLWNTYHPNWFLFVLLGLGTLTFVSLFIYDRFTQKKRS
jgi:POT family proton-dependent oligopeptide transporter